MIAVAAMSHSDSSGSAQMSTEPSATIMYGQKSPYPRVRQQARVRSRRPSRRPCASQPDNEEKANEASAIRSTCDTCILVAEVRLRPVNAPAPFAAHQRRFSAGAETTPITGWKPPPLSSSLEREVPPPSATISEISVAHTGTPRT
ncbi:hypothetical protein EES46_10600 [Streptomyces sp. ADI98-10]|nr:hypothetical protein EES46_10600 [Streptomyces sp. ADI98-10]